MSQTEADALYVWQAGGAFTGLTSAGFRDTSADFDVSLVFTSAIPLDAGRTVTVDVGNANRALTLYGDFVVPSGGGTAVLLGADNIFTGANEVHNAAGFVARPSILQDGVALKGRAGGTFSYTAAITTAELTASRAFTIPAVSADDTFALLGIANAFTGANTFTNAAGIVTRAAATQDGVALVGRAGGTSSYIATITTAALTASRTFTIPAVTGNDTFALLGVAQTFTAAQTYSGGTNSAAPTILGSFSNTTAAISGTQSASPGIEFIGQGFKTGTGSQETKWRIYNLPIQGATLDTGLMFGYSVNGGAYTDQMRLTGTDGVYYKGLSFNGDMTLVPSLSSNATKMTFATASLALDFSSAPKHSWSSTAYTLAEGVNIVGGTSTGTKIGSATTQKFAFWNAAPVVQPAHIADPSGGAIQDAEARAAIVSILAWQATLGLTAAS